MVKSWVVKHSGHKGTYLRKEPSLRDDSTNVLGVVKNGESVQGEFLHIRRASREEGFVKVKHLKLQCGFSWRIENADKSPSTLLRKQPQEAHDAGNTAGHAVEGELVNGEFLFVAKPGEKRGGYIKICHLRAASRHGSAPPASIGRLQQSAPPKRFAAEAQRWIVLDASHDGAWLRKTPLADRRAENVVCLIANGDTVIGDFMHAKCRNGTAGLILAKLLEHEVGNAYKVLGVDGSPTVALRRKPEEACDAGNMAGHAKVGEIVQAEFVHVTRKDGKRSGFVKRRYLTACSPDEAAS